MENMEKALLIYRRSPIDEKKVVVMELFNSYKSLNHNNFSEGIKYLVSAEKMWGSNKYISKIKADIKMNNIGIAILELENLIEILIDEIAPSMSSRSDE